MELELKKTPMQELLHNLKNMDTIPTNEIDTTLEAIIKAIESVYIDKERVEIKKAFNAGEINMHNSKRDECFEYEGGADYYEKYYLTPNDLI